MQRFQSLYSSFKRVLCQVMDRLDLKYGLKLLAFVKGFEQDDSSSGIVPSFLQTEAF